MTEPCNKTTLTLDTYLLRRAGRIATLAWFTGPFCGLLERRAAVIFRYAEEARQMREMLDAIVEECAAAEYAAFDPPLGCEHEAALAELWRVCAEFGAGRV